MDLITETIQLDTDSHNAIYDITEQVQEIIGTEGFAEGQALVSAVGSTSGISTLEYEPGLVRHDIGHMLDKLAPYGLRYEHNKTWGDGNGASHLRSFLVKTSQTFPFANGRLLLGTWQQIVLINFDTRPRNRKIVVQVMGKRGGK